MRRIVLVILVLLMVGVAIILALTVANSSSNNSTDVNAASQHLTDTLSPFYLTRGVEQTSASNTAIVRKKTEDSELKIDPTIQPNQPLNGTDGIPAIKDNLMVANTAENNDKIRILLEDYVLSHLPVGTDLTKPLQAWTGECTDTGDDIGFYITPKIYSNLAVCMVEITGTFNLNPASNNGQIVPNLMSFFAEKTGNLLIEVVTAKNPISYIPKPGPYPTVTPVIVPHLTLIVESDSTQTVTINVDDVKKFLSQPQLKDIYGNILDLPPTTTKIDKIELMTMQQYISEYGANNLTEDIVDPANRLIYVGILDTEFYDRYLQSNTPPPPDTHGYFLFDAHTGQLLANYFEP